MKRHFIITAQQAIQKCMRFIYILILTSFMYECKTSKSSFYAQETDSSKAYGYQPIDPLPVDVYLDGKVVQPAENKEKILDVLSDETMRLSVGQVNENGSVTYGPAKIGIAGSSYVIVIDYIKSQSLSSYFKYMRKQNGQIGTIYSLGSIIPETQYPEVIRIGDRIDTSSFPIYLGIGLRLMATITVKKGEVNLGNLFAIGAAADEKRVTGTIIIQTLGITGEKITSLMLLPSEVTSSTIQSAILALGTVKSKIYDKEGVLITPKVIGFYNTIGGDRKTILEFQSKILSAKPWLFIYNKKG